MDGVNPSDIRELFKSERRKFNAGIRKALGDDGRAKEETRIERIRRWRDRVEQARIEDGLISIDEDKADDAEDAPPAEEVRPTSALPHVPSEAAEQQHQPTDATAKPHQARFRPAKKGSNVKPIRNDPLALLEVRAKLFPIGQAIASNPFVLKHSACKQVRRKWHVR